MNTAALHQEQQSKQGRCKEIYFTQRPLRAQSQLGQWEGSKVPEGSPPTPFPLEDQSSKTLRWGSWVVQRMLQSKREI